MRKRKHLPVVCDRVISCCSCVREALCFAQGDKIVPRILPISRRELHESVMSLILVRGAVVQEDEQWSDAFQRASDAVWMSANREQEWDELLREKGTRNVVQVCKGRERRGARVLPVPTG